MRTQDWRDSVQRYVSSLTSYSAPFSKKFNSAEAPANVMLMLGLHQWWCRRGRVVPVSFAQHFPFHPSEEMPALATVTALSNLHPRSHSHR